MTGKFSKVLLAVLTGATLCLSTAAEAGRRTGTWRYAAPGWGYGGGYYPAAYGYGGYHRAYYGGGYGGGWGYGHPGYYGGYYRSGPNYGAVLATSLIAGAALGALSAPRYHRGYYHRGYAVRRVYYRPRAYYHRAYYPRHYYHPRAHFYAW